LGISILTPLEQEADAKDGAEKQVLAFCVKWWNGKWSTFTISTRIIGFSHSMGRVIFTSTSITNQIPIFGYKIYFLFRTIYDL